MAALAAAAGQQATAALEHAAAALAAARRHATSALAAARRHTVGYDYATVVERGEWWRLSASLVGPGGLAPLVVMAYAIPCGRGTVADAVWWTAALHSGGCLGGLAWTRRGGRDDVTGAAGAAAGWAAKRATDGAVGAPALVVADEAMLCIKTRTQPAMSRGCDAHCVFDSLLPSKGTEKSAVNNVLDCDNDR